MDKPILYRCCPDWEYNGYNDSDWYCVAYNADTDQLERIETGTTRFAEALHIDHGILPMTDEMRPRAIEALTKLLITERMRLNKLYCEEPNIKHLTKDTEVIILNDHRCQKKEKSQEKILCKKCDGLGYWQNPRNKSDQRECFGCRGAKEIAIGKRVKCLDDNGKPMWEKISAGTHGKVISQSSFGTFYHNGYNQPDRNNTTIYLKLDDGREVQAPASKLRLNKTPINEIETRALVEKDLEDNAEGWFYSCFRTSACSLV